MSDDKPDIKDYKRRVELKGQSVVIDVQTPVEERSDMKWINASIVTEYGWENWRYGDEFPDPESYDCDVFFHTRWGRGFTSRNGEWNELTALTDFFRGIANTDADYEDLAQHSEVNPSLEE